MPAKRRGGAQKVRLKDRRRRLSYVYVGGAVVLFVGVIAATAYVTRLPGVTVSTVRVEGAVHVAARDIETVANGVLSGSYVLLVPKRMSYVVPRGAVQAAVVEAFPAVQSVGVRRSNLSTLEVTVIERTPTALWCGSLCYKMDAYGYIFDLADDDSGLRTFEGLVEDPIGSTYLDGNFHDFNAYLDRIESVAGVRIAGARVDALDVFVQLDGGGELRYARDRDSEVLLADIGAVFSAPDFKSRSAVEYVELRFGEKAVVKFRGEG